MSVNVKRNLYLLVGFVILLLTGLIYAWSIFIVPLENEFGWDRAETSIIFTITMAAFCLGSMVNGFIIGRTSPRFTLIVSAVLFFVGFFFASRTGSLGQIFISYGILVGFGVGLVYNTIISTISKWFPDRKGFSSGVSLMGFGLGGFVLGSVATSLINVGGWRTVFIAFAVAFPILVIVSSFIIRNPKENEAEHLPKPKNTLGDSKPEVTADIKTSGMLKRPVFWLYFIWSILLSAAGLVVIGHAATIAEGFANLPLTIAMAVGMVTIFNGVARVCFGLFFDKFGLKKSIFAVSGVGIIASLSMVFSIVSDSPILMLFAFVMTGMFYGGVPTINSTFVMTQFGPKHFPANFSIVNLCLLVAPTLGTYVAGVLWTSTGAYLTSSIVMAAYTVVAIILSVVITKLIKA